MPLDLTQLHVMGILNVTPDSFSDGGQFLTPAAALAEARQMVAAGATIIDIGGESTRPGAQPVTEQTELDRVVPLVEQLQAELPVTISVDTSKPAVMQAAIAAGATLINDVMALRQPGALDILAAAPATVQVCLMHMQGEPRTMQQQPHYSAVVQEVSAFLLQRAKACIAAGIAAERIILDPGFGFGKTPNHNLQLIQQIEQLTALPYPILLGVSRKSTLGAITGKPVQERLYPGLALAALAWAQGVKIIRTHDVAATVEILQTIQAVLTGLPE